MKKNTENKNEQTKEKKYSRCIRCGRKLKDEESQTIGMGKICFKKYKKSKEYKKLF